ncbi:pantetheine-phosphate adenylyltransferase [Arcanobacterium hippocoleae]
MKLAICPGSFDPITFGHIDVIERAANLFDEVIVAVAMNSQKNYLFQNNERVQLAREALMHLPNVQVELVSGLIADFAKARNAGAIVKGLRGSADFSNEETMALLNRNLSGIETIFLLSDSALSHVASSYVKEIAAYNGPIDKLVPKNVAAAIQKKIG